LVLHRLRFQVLQPATFAILRRYHRHIIVWCPLENSLYGPKRSSRKHTTRCSFVVPVGKPNKRASLQSRRQRRQVACPSTISLVLQSPHHLQGAKRVLVSSAVPSSVPPCSPPGSTSEVPNELPSVLSRKGQVTRQAGYLLALQRPRHLLSQASHPRPHPRGNQVTRQVAPTPFLQQQRRHP